MILAAILVYMAPLLCVAYVVAPFIPSFEPERRPSPERRQRIFDNW